MGVVQKFSVKDDGADYEVLNHIGTIVFLNKFHNPDACPQNANSKLCDEFKANNAFISDDIVEKFDSIDRIIEPRTTQGNLDFLTLAGFKDISTIQKSMNFDRFLAIR